MERRNLILVAVVVIILGVSAFLLTRGGGGGVDGGVPPDDVDRGDNGVPQGPDDGEEETVDTETYGDGGVKVTLIVEVPDWTPPEDVVFAQFDGFYGATGWGVPMEEVEAGVWAVSFLAPDNRPLTYKYNRNNGGYATDEEFTPDSMEARRTVDVVGDELVIRDIVGGWRWLSETPLEATFPDYVPEERPQRDEDFVVGITLLDFYSGSFDEFVGPTLDRIAGLGFEYIGFAYAPSFFTSGDPLEFTREPLNTYSVEQLEEAFEAARSRGLKIMLSAGLETNPGGFDEIEEGIRGAHDDGWFRELVGEWEEAMVATAELAEEHGVEILALSNQWPFFGDPTAEQKVWLNELIKDAIRSVNEVYSGKLTTDYYSWDEVFDYYSELDWLGDKWWWEITDDRDAGYEDLVAGAEARIVEYYTPMHELYGKPIFLNQLAYASYDGAAGANQVSTEAPEVAEWYPDDPDWPADFQEQVDAYEAVFRAISGEEYFTGVFAFGYGYWELQEKSAGIRGKPAEDVWVRWNEILTK